MDLLVWSEAQMLAPPWDPEGLGPMARGGLTRAGPLKHSHMSRPARWG